jgi:uncharacterized coiled-coil protein SlyX
MSETTDPNRLGPVTREWIAALERRIEQLELRVGDLEQAPEGDDIDFPIPMKLPSIKARLGATTVRPPIDLSDEAPATVGRADIPERGGVGRYEEMSQRLQVAEQRAAQQDHDYRVLNDKYSNAMVEIERLRAQLAARPVVTATDEQIDELFSSYAFSVAIGEKPTREQHLRSWLSTLGVASVKQVEAWVAGDRPPNVGEVAVDASQHCVYQAVTTHGKDSASRVLNRVTLNVVQEPTNE